MRHIMLCFMVFALAMFEIAMPSAVDAQQQVRVVGQAADGIDRNVLTTPEGRVQVDEQPTTLWTYASPAGGIVNTTTAVTVKSAAGAGLRNYICGIQLSHGTLSATTEFAVRDGAAGTVLWRGALQTTATDIANTSGIAFRPCLRGTANTLVEVVTLTAVTGGVIVNLQGYSGG